MKLHAALALAVCVPCLAQDLYTIAPETNTLQVFDVDTLDFADVGELGVPFDFGDLAWDGKRLFMVQGYAGTGLYEVNIQTGEATFIGSHGYSNMFGLEYDPTSDSLFGTKASNGQGLYKIDRQTGEATEVGAVPIGIDTLSFDPTRDQVVGASAGGGMLWDVDTTLGTATLIHDGEFFNQCGMTYLPSQDVHWLMDWSGNVFTFDPNDDFKRTTVLENVEPHAGLAYVDACDADCDGNDVLNVLDFVCFQQLFQNEAPAADCNGDGALNVLDFVCFQLTFQGGC